MADKATQLILGALGRAAAEPGGAPLFGSRTAVGLFGSTPAARQAAQRCVESGYLRPVVGEGKASRDAYTLTDRGLAYLLEQVHPRQVLEDFVRALESRESQLRQLLDSVRQTQAELEGLRTNAETVLRELKSPTSPNRNGSAASPQADWTTTALTFLKERRTSEDCPLPLLYQHLLASASDLSIGRFHDGLRKLHDEERIYLHPWTGPLYALPEPPYALLVGHEVAYYVSLRG